MTAKGEQTYTIASSSAPVASPTATHSPTTAPAPLANDDTLPTPFATPTVPVEEDATLTKKVKPRKKKDAAAI